MSKSKKRKREDDIEEEWLPGVDDPPRKQHKKEEKVIASRKRKYLKAFNKAVALNPNGVPLRVTQRITKEQYKWLDRDIEVGELWYMTGDPYSCATPGGWMARKDDANDAWAASELPKSHISVELSVPASDL